MTTYEQLEQSAYDQRIILLSHPLSHVDGFYYATSNFATITLSTSLVTTNERCCVLAHELGHHFMPPPDLFVSSKVTQDRHEYLATKHAVDTLVPLPRLVDAWNKGVRDIYELADYLDVTVPFIVNAVDLLERRYGPRTRYGDYCINFRPMEVYTA